MHSKVEELKKKKDTSNVKISPVTSDTIASIETCFENEEWRKANVWNSLFNSKVSATREGNKFWAVYVSDRR